MIYYEPCLRKVEKVYVNVKKEKFVYICENCTSHILATNDVTGC